MIKRINDKGFTLIELMIVVGIIGILVAIAAPNFSKYQSKARQSEAKIALSAVYAGEKSFYSEYNAYMGAMDPLGYAPEGAKRFYSIGWASAPSGTVTGYSGSSSTPSYTRTGFPASWTNCTITLSSQVTTTDIQSFTTTAAGQITNSTNTNCDTWTVDDQKNIQNTTLAL